ncbi:SDR family NAD(P)-dependent oxidoreductase [Notoacmeibacter sp. MSK16QG-6]|uniref:SDR family NAD(P)-dependent oxidoreductase n=1 Tax=Notoacmeibacter sp. MSK16QG-6 TaxID=2957982 RepID=UPI00209C9C9A|nr:SDR family oxidoreductase [Notoacmeibacter sp. MSK16QG-6]MCP1198341.1 SDR family oxidoreductase [Notoacmeibacter sp. MSK16QG-6]
MHIVLTGASEGIGGAALKLLAQNAKPYNKPLRIVMTASGRKPAPDALISELQNMGAETLYLTGDLGEESTAIALAEKALEFLDNDIDLFVSNAGAGAPAKLFEQSLAEWDRMFDLNVRSTFILAQKFYHALKTAGGSVVAVASMSGMQAHPGQAAYAPAKAALISLVENLAIEWAPDGIRVNAVAPGMIRTPLTEKLYQKEGVLEAREERVPLGRVGKPDDIANIIRFLGSAEAAYITGQTILADGGISATGLLDIPA